MTANRLGSTRSIILMAEMAALTAVCSQIMIPLTPIPANLALLAVFLTGGLLGAKRASLTMTAYLLLGTFGVPVFSGFRSGPGALFGPTGGFLFGYLGAAYLTGLLSRKAENKTARYILPMTAGLIVCYGMGTAWFMILTNRTFVEALLICVVPFLPGDAVKIAVAAVLSSRLKRFVDREVMID